MTVIEAFDSKVLDFKDFYFMGDDYRYHIESNAKRRFLDLLKSRFNDGAKYEGRIWKWDTIITNKTQELARFLLRKSEALDFTQPSPKLARSDDQPLRQRILELTTKEAKERGVCRSTLHNLHGHATNPKPFRVYKKVADRLLERSSRKS